MAHGHRLHYREQGSGPLLLILPGNTASSASHTGELEYYGRRFRAVSLDFWGTGESERLERWPDGWWEQRAQDVAALVDHLGAEPCLVMGPSGGAVASLHLATRSPALVRAVIADSCPSWSSGERLACLVAGRAARLPGQVAFWRHAHGADWEQVVGADNDLLMRSAACGIDWFGDTLRAIRCPVLLVASLRDSLLPDVGSQALDMAHKIRGCRVYLSDAGDHALMWSRADEFRSVADAFLAHVVSV
ncbi:MAG: alpha/beta fold hydrolase [Anaerolineae bacterium]